MTARYLARSVAGLEWVAAAEIGGRFPSSPIAMARREIRFDLSAPNAAVTALRTVDDVFLVVGVASPVGATKQDVAPLATRLSRWDWPALDAETFDVVASLEGRRTYNRFDVENAVGRAIEPVLQARYVARAPDQSGQLQSDATVRIFVRTTEAVAALRVAPRPLHRRPWKLDTGPGTLHPPVAAALCELAGLAAGDVVIDPFCGDGTVVIEAALAAPGAQVRGGDIDPQRIGHARANAVRAGVDVSFTVEDAGGSGWAHGGPSAVITNPPWNRAVDRGGRLDRSLAPFWSQVERALRPGGRLCLIADADLDLARQLRARGFPVALATQIRLAGRVSEVVLAADRLPAALARWRDTALAEGVISETGW